MSKHSDLARDLETFPQGAVLALVQPDGYVSNVAFRTRDLEGELGWALAGKPEPWSSDTLASGIIAFKGGYLVLDKGNRQ